MSGVAIMATPKKPTGTPKKDVARNEPSVTEIQPAASSRGVKVDAEFYEKLFQVARAAKLDMGDLIEREMGDFIEREYQVILLAKLEESRRKTQTPKA